MKLNTGLFLTQVFTCICEISYGKGIKLRNPSF